MLAPSAMLGAAAGTAAASGGGAGPSGPPTSVSIFKYGEGLTGLQWTNGDVTATTQIGKDSSIDGPPASVHDTAAAGATSIQTDQTCSCFWFARHSKNGQFSVWVRATGCILGQNC